MSTTKLSDVSVSSGYRSHTTSRNTVYVPTWSGFDVYTVSGATVSVCASVILADGQVVSVKPSTDSNKSVPTI